MKLLTPNGWKRFDVSDPVHRIYCEFEQGVINEDRSVYETAMDAFAKEWILSPMQVVAIRIVLSDVEVLFKGCDNKIIREWQGASARNILECVVNNYWDMANLFLSERSRPVKYLDEVKDHKFYREVDGKKVEITAEQFFGIED